jgi:hypothetical protein
VYSGSGTLVGSSTGETASVTVSGPTGSYGVATSETVQVRLQVTDCYGATSASSSVDLTIECTGE